MPPATIARVSRRTIRRRQLPRRATKILPQAPAGCVIGFFVGAGRPRARGLRRPPYRTSRWRSVGVQVGVELHGLALAGECLDRAGGGIAAEKQVGNPGELQSLD